MLAALKINKARDPAGLVNELLSSAGTMLKVSLLELFNTIKLKQVRPEFLNSADCVTIYEGKGKKDDLKNERGVFIVSIFRSILLKMLYKRTYKTVDESMSDSNIGARKKKNVRNHVWMVNGIICDVLSKTTNHTIDIQILDYKQCFDSLWLQACLNNAYDSGIQDDSLTLLYNVNKSVNLAVRTPVGQTQRKTIHSVVLQSDIFGSLLCSNQIDTFGKECINENKYIYKYKGVLDIPPLGMVDDLLCISECGHKTSMLNSFINHKTNRKKLQFRVDKCKKLHVGKTREAYKCRDLYIDGWKVKGVKNTSTGGETIEDTYEGPDKVETTDSEKYLGDIISSDGKNTKNIQNRENKGHAASTQVQNILESIYFGKYFFQAAVLLRNSLLVSSMLFNSEAWYHVTTAEIETLEKIDETCIRKFLNAPFATPRIILYLELGVMPLRYIIKSRRLNYLHYILNEDTNSMIYQFLQIQLQNPTKKDWGSEIRKDIQELNLGVEIEEIKKHAQNNI